MANSGATSKKQRQRKANIAAALSVAFIALFAFAFIGIIVMLNDYADKLEIERNLDRAANETAPDEPFYIVLIGSDSRKGTAVYRPESNDTSQDTPFADIITLMRIDPKNHQITLLTIPRDTVLNGHDEKINSTLNSNDPQNVVDAVEELTGVDVKGYIMTTFISFENLINALGGIDVDVPKTVKVIDPATGKNVTVKRGKNQHLDGSQALVLARAREEYGSDQDALRQVNVRKIERAMIQKVLDMDGSFNVEHVMAALDEDTKTNLDLPAMGSLIKDFVEHANDIVIYDGTGRYEGGQRPNDNEWVVADDEQLWEQLMAAVDAGKDPSTLVTPPSF